MKWGQKKGGSCTFHTLGSQLAARCFIVGGVGTAAMERRCLLLPHTGDGRSTVCLELNEEG